MYRKLLLFVLCASMVQSAPQQDSNITHIKQNIELEYLQPNVTAPERESRIEKLPLTIPGNIVNEPFDNNTNKDTENVKYPINDKQPTYNYSDRIYSIKTKPKKNNNTTEPSIPSDEEVKESESKKTDVNSKTNDSDIVPAESILRDTLSKNEGSRISSESDATQSDEFVTEKYEEELTVTTEVYEETTKAPAPRLLPKLSYFGKSALGSFSQNLIANPGKRRFKSRCRCEKIWNCAKLQITVPRCPEEYFLCCS